MTWPNHKTIQNLMLRLLRCTVADPTCNKTASKIWIRHDMGLTLTLGFCLKLGQLTSQLFKSVEKSALQSSSPFFLCWHQVDQNSDLNVYICMDVLFLFTCLLWDGQYKIYLGTNLLLDFVYFILGLICFRLAICFPFVLNMSPCFQHDFSIFNVLSFLQVRSFCMIFVRCFNVFPWFVCTSPGHLTMLRHFACNVSICPLNCFSSFLPYFTDFLCAAPFCF